MPISPAKPTVEDLALELARAVLGEDASADQVFGFTFGQVVGRVRAEQPELLPAELRWQAIRRGGLLRAEKFRDAQRELLAAKPVGSAEGSPLAPPAAE